MEINQDYLFDGNEGWNYTSKNYSESGILENRRPLSRIEKIIVHCTATDSEAWNDPIACIKFDTAGNSGNSRLPKKGCPFCTYHFYVNKKGKAYQLVSMNFQTMNARGHNRDSVAVCINHGAVKDNVTDEQFDALIEVICHIIDFLDFPYDIEELKNIIYFHRQLDSSKTCPGKLDYENVINSVSEKLKTRGDIE
jgi:N-acetyl-anhydromuramyl-L-alanine amidase AmpD